MIQKNFLLPDDIAALIPSKGQKEFIIRAIKMAAGVSGVAAPAVSEVASPAPPAASKEYTRDGKRFIPTHHGEACRREGGKLIFAKSIEAPHIDVHTAYQWYEYCGKWRWPDPFPGLVEWFDMGCPEKPEEAHRLPEYRSPVEPVEAPAVEERLATVQVATGAECATLPDDI